MTSARQGMTRTWPTLISLGSAIPFAFLMAATVTPNLAAMPLRVSPLCTVYRRVLAGTGVWLGAAFVGLGVLDGDGVGPVVGAGVPDVPGVDEGDADAETGAEAGAALNGAGDPEAAGDEPLAAAAAGTPGGADGACVDGAVVRAMTRTRNARTISATRSVCPPARPCAIGRDPVRPPDGSSARGVALTAGHSREPSDPGGEAADPGADHVPAAARYVAQPA